MDNVPDEFKVIDGAKGKWCNLLLLDAMIYLLKNDQFVGNSRRHFNQYMVLYECIMEELRTVDFQAYNEIIDFKNKETWALRSKFIAGYQETPLPSVEERSLKYSYLGVRLTPPWSTMAELRLCLLDGPPSKAKSKFTVMTELLANHEYFQKYNHDLRQVIETVLVKSILLFNTHKPLNITVLPKRAGSVTSSEDNSSVDSPAVVPQLTLKMLLAQQKALLSAATAGEPLQLAVIKTAKRKQNKKKFDESCSDTSDLSDEPLTAKVKKAKKLKVLHCEPLHLKRSDIAIEEEKALYDDDFCMSEECFEKLMDFAELDGNLLGTENYHYTVPETGMILSIYILLLYLYL